MIRIRTLSLSSVVGLALSFMTTAARAANPAPAAPSTTAMSTAAPAVNFGGQGFGADGQWAFTIQSLGAGKGSPSIFFQKVSGGTWTVGVQPSVDTS